MSGDIPSQELSHFYIQPFIMPVKIGLLLPRSTDHPAMGFDMLDGIRAGFAHLGIQDVQVVTDKIGFGGRYRRQLCAKQKRCCCRMMCSC